MEKGLLREFAVKILSGLIVVIIQIWIFYPQIFSSGISNINFAIIFKTLLGICVLFVWMYTTIHYKTKNIINDNNILKVENEKLNAAIIELRESIKRKVGDHFYTTSEKERIEAIQKHRYIDEDITCYVFSVKTEGTVPLYRLFRA